MNNEYDRFIKYLLAGNGIKGCEEFCSKEWLQSFQNNLKPYESPDMIAELDDELVIFEHFQFDGTKKTNKGMKGIQEENKIESEINNFFNEGEEGTFITATKEKASPVEYWNNFIYAFQKHYSKINSYKLNLDEININDKKITTGFCIENKYPPYVRCSERKNKRSFLEEVCLIESSEFLDLFEKSNDIDFVILCGIYNCNYMAIYVNKKMIPYLRECSYSIKNISFWNKNEMEFSSLMKITTKE